VVAAQLPPQQPQQQQPAPMHQQPAQQSAMNSWGTTGGVPSWAPPPQPQMLGSLALYQSQQLTALEGPITAQAAPLLLELHDLYNRASTLIGTIAPMLMSQRAGPPHYGAPTEVAGGHHGGHPDTSERDAFGGSIDNYPLAPLLSVGVTARASPQGEHPPPTPHLLAAAAAAASGAGTQQPSPANLPPRNASPVTDDMLRAAAVVDESEPAERPQYVRASQAVAASRGRGGMALAGPRHEATGMHTRLPPGSTYICVVEFKRGRMKKYPSSMYVEPGSYVLVEGDRGTDCGLVVYCCYRDAAGVVSQETWFENVVVELDKIKAEARDAVYRVASEADIVTLHGEIASLERYALRTCRERVTQMNLHMDVIDCEYQFDRKKVTFYFDSPEAIDFRELAKDLFKIFGSRIWLENVNSRVKNVVPDGAFSHADKVLFAERGLRPLPR
jgi:hypothetical protein